MKRNPSANAQRSRAPSPTNTTYSGISNYRSESYRPLRENTPSFPGVDPRAVARTHFDELHRYLASYLAKEPANSRSTARQKLTRLTKQQFQELSTDVYDELVRRKNNTSDNEVPFLPVREDFHPKRNQARQKLATLPTSRFKDLSSDVYYELARRYPEFKDEVPDAGVLTSPGSNYGDDSFPSPDYPNSAVPPSATPLSALRSADPYSPAPTSARRSEDIYGGMDSFSSSAVTLAPSVSSRRKPSQDIYSDRRRPSQDTTVRRSEDNDSSVGAGIGRSISVTSSSTATTTTTGAQSATAGMGMIIPNKSTIAEEEIEVPYGREVRDSTGTAVDDRDRRDRSNERSREDDTDADGDDDRIGGLGGLAGLSGLSARLQQQAEAEEEAGGARSDDYYEKMSFGRASVTSDRPGSSSSRPGRTSAAGGENHEQIRRDYEFKIATMQSRITGLERDLEDSQLREQKAAESEDRVRALEVELEELRVRAEEQSNGMRALQKELDTLREDRAREQDISARRALGDEEELQILRDRCEQLEAERGSSQADPEILDQLRADMEGLLVELADLSKRNDELMNAKDSDLVLIQNLDAQMKEYKRKYENVKTELRSLKATSQLFLQAPKTDDQLPVSPDGGLLDIHVTQFLSAIDSLLTAGRSNAPTRVLTPMKAVVNAVTTIVDDVRAFERRPRRDRSEVDVDALRSLRERAEATLSNLTAAAKTHATSSGMSPVSLLDAAASHVSATVTDIAKTVLVRKASKLEIDQFNPPPLVTPSATSNGFSPSLRSVDEHMTRPNGGVHQRGMSSASTRRGTDESYKLNPEPIASPPPSSRTTQLGRTSVEEQRRPFSNPSSSEGSANSPPPTFDSSLSSQNPFASGESTAVEGPDDAWAELKPYLEAQTESIVFAIQAVLGAVKNSTTSPNLDENITQIITIVSSIVAVCKDNLPPGSVEKGEEVLRELSDHANRLSEAQVQGEFSKETRQVMAKSSFAVANAMKQLMKL